MPKRSGGKGSGGSDGGHWVTIKHGQNQGRVVRITDSGTILGGNVPAAEQGKKISEMTLPKVPPPGSNQAKEAERAEASADRPKTEANTKFTSLAAQIVTSSGKDLMRPFADKAALGALDPAALEHTYQAMVHAGLVDKPDDARRDAALVEATRAMTPADRAGFKHIANIGYQITQSRGDVHFEEVQNPPPVFKESGDITDYVASYVVRMFAAAWPMGPINKMLALMLPALEHTFGLTDVYEHDTMASHRKYIQDLLQDPHFMTGFRAAALAIYADTQTQLKKLGITHVPLFRGVKLTPDEVAERWKSYSLSGFGEDNIRVAAADVRLKALSSFSTAFETADSFGSIVLFSAVPRENIFCAPNSGLGAVYASELCVLGGVMPALAMDFQNNHELRSDVRKYSAKDLYELCEDIGKELSGTHKARGPAARVVDIDAGDNAYWLANSKSTVRSKGLDVPIRKGKSSGDGHWVTIKHGQNRGRRVLIDDDGTILGGNVPAAEQGKKISEMTLPKIPPPGSNQAKEAERAGKPAGDAGEKTATTAFDGAKFAGAAELQSMWQLAHDYTEEGDKYADGVAELKRVNYQGPSLAEPALNMLEKRWSSLSATEKTGIIDLALVANYIATLNAATLRKKFTTYSDEDDYEYSYDNEYYPELNGKDLVKEMRYGFLGFVGKDTIDMRRDLLESGLHKPGSDYQDVQYAIPMHTLGNVLHTSWSASSDGSSPISLLLQHEANKLFKLDASTSHMGKGPDGEAVVGFLPELEQRFPQLGTGLRVMAQAVYDATQAAFKAQGITRMLLFRGSAIQRSKLGDVPDAGFFTRTEKLQPLSSFSSDRRTAESFIYLTKETRKDPLDYGLLMVAEIPAEHIFSAPSIGLGCEGESEFIVLGHPVTSLTGGVSLSRRDEAHIPLDPLGDAKVKAAIDAAAQAATVQKARKASIFNADEDEWNREWIKAVEKKHGNKATRKKVARIYAKGQAAWAKKLKQRKAARSKNHVSKALKPGEHWVTIKHGQNRGRRVLIDKKGRIVAGNVPADEQGRKISRMKKPSIAPVGSNQEAEDAKQAIVDDYAEYPGYPGRRVKINEERVRAVKAVYRKHIGAAVRKMVRNPAVKPFRQDGLERMATMSLDELMLDSDMPTAIGLMGEPNRQPFRLELKEAWDVLTPSERRGLAGAALIAPLLTQSRIWRRSIRLDEGGIAADKQAAGIDDLSKILSQKQLLGEKADFGPTMQLAQRLSLFYTTQWPNGGIAPPFASVLMQSLTNDALGLGDTEKSKAAKQYLVDSGIQALLERHEDFQAGLHTLVRMVYASTQTALAAAHIDYIPVFRGMELGPKFDEPDMWKTVTKSGMGMRVDKVPLSPMSAFSTRAVVATNYGPTMLMTQVPREQVLTMPGLGFGYRDCSEITVLGSDAPLGIVHFLPEYAQVRGQADDVDAHYYMNKYSMRRQEIAFKIAKRLANMHVKTKGVSKAMANTRTDAFPSPDDGGKNQYWLMAVREKQTAAAKKRAEKRLHKGRPPWMPGEPTALDASANPISGKAMGDELLTKGVPDKLGQLIEKLADVERHGIKERALSYAPSSVWGRLHAQGEQPWNGALVLYDLKTERFEVAPAAWMLGKTAKQAGYRVTRIPFTSEDNPTRAAIRWATAEDGRGLSTTLEDELFVQFHTMIGSLKQRARALAMLLGQSGWSVAESERFAAMFWFRLCVLLQAKSGPT